MSSTESASTITLFDGDAYLATNEARRTVVDHVIAELRRSGRAPSSAYDLGAGPGWFSGELTRAGLDVVGLEGRPEVVEEARRRTPGVRFETCDFDAVDLSALPPKRDFVLAFGILYHLENPLRMLRIARMLCRDVLLLETMTLPEALPMGRVIRENDNETQGMRQLALLLSPSAIEWGLWAAGFRHIKRYSGQLAHPDFVDTAEQHRRRHIWLASDADLPVRDFEPVVMKEPRRANFWQRE